VALFAVLTAAVLAPVVAPGSAAAGQLSPRTGNGNLWRNEKSNLCLAVSGSSYDNGAPIIQWGCVNSQDQYWKLGRMTSAYGSLWYEIVNGMSGRCLGVQGGSFANGAKLVQYTCFHDPKNHPDQYWWNRDIGRDSRGNLEYEFRNLLQSACVAVEGGSTSWGGAVVQWQCNSHTDQYWYTS
jgi:hypothetical protein